MLTSRWKPASRSCSLLIGQRSRLRNASWMIRLFVIPTSVSPLISSTSSRRERTKMAHVNPDILRWARKTSGLTLDEAVAKLSIKDARGIAAVDRLKALEAGDNVPTRSMLGKMALHYRRPLLTFYLAHPPRRRTWGKDFRAPTPNRSVRNDALLDALVRDVQARQGLIRAAILEDNEDTSPRHFIGSATPQTPVERVVGAIRDTIGLELREYQAAPSADAAFRLLRSRTEGAGVFVLVLGNLGNHLTDLEVDVFRGFALTDVYAPFVVVNPKDSPGAKSFTLLHELAHLWLNEPGISGVDPTDPVEVVCNKVASHFLLPEKELVALKAPDNPDGDAWAKSITAFAGPRRISSSMVAYRLYRHDVIDQATWLLLRGLFRERWLKGRRAMRQRLQRREGGLPLPVRVRYHVGAGLVDLASQLVASGHLSATRASRVLGVSPSRAYSVFAVQ